MAVTSITYSITRWLFEDNLLPRNATVLEFGESNWNGDIRDDELADDIKKHAVDKKERATLLARLRKLSNSDMQTRLFGTAKIFYRLYYGCRKVDSIDLNGTDAAIAHNLNEDYISDEPVDVTINNGTAEHVFFAGRVFQSMHRCTKPGGMMVHQGPLINGWVDHGFYNFQPTLFYDLARQNNYDILFFVGQNRPFQVVQIESHDDVMAVTQSPGFPANPSFFVVFRKPDSDTDFAVPMQGFYAGTISEPIREAWHQE